ncbi:MAG: sulfatase-like hydrolase/transferase [Bacteroidota bacterium]
MKYFFPFLLCCLFCACQPTEKSAPSDPQETERPPNVILLIGDDQGYPYFGFMGADYVQTPNMDALAKSGMVFTHAYVPDNHCRPSLQTLMTGTLPIDYNRQVDTLLNEQLKIRRFTGEQQKQEWVANFRHLAMRYFPTLPKYLAQKGYASFQGGKWWEFNYQNGGFTHGMTQGWTPEDKENGSRWFKKFMGGDGLQLARATMQPAYDFIDQHADQAFFMWFAPELPHYPFDAPDKYYNLYKDQEMTESAKRYYANCSWFDDGVGALMNHLRSKNLLDNTLIIYVNDNGWEQNPDQEFRSDSLRWHNGGDKGKLSMYDQSFRTPIIFSWPGKIEAGVVRKDLMHSADIPATILDVLDIPLPKHFFGQSYLPLIEGQQKELRKYIVGNVDQVRWEGDMMGRKLEGYWLREKDWFFHWNKTDGEKALYNMKEDPFNNQNLAAEQTDLVDRFTLQIKDWKETKGR